MQGRRTQQIVQGRTKIQRWYRGFSYKGNPRELIEQVSKHIQQLGLAKFLPLLRLEKGAKPNKAFYFFIAIESENIGTIPSQVEQTYLLQLPFFKTPADKKCPHFTYDQIKEMIIGMAYDVQDYTNPIPYRSQVKAIYENSLALFNSSQTQLPDPQEISNSSLQYEHLLYWLSALGNGTWESFQKTCEILKLDEPKWILRRLKLLGHVTTSHNGKKWQVSPPSLLEVSSNQENNDRIFILRGQRSVNFLERLKLYGSIDITHQPRGESPSCVRFCLPQLLGIETVIQKLSDRYTIHFSTLEELPDLKTWKLNLQVVLGILPSNFTLKQFNGNDFNDFTECIFQKRTGLYQFFTEDTSKIPQYTFFYDENSNRWMQGDGYGLRFLVISEMANTLLVKYDRIGKVLAIPFSQRWAEVYERRLVMTSGLLPSYQNGWLFYKQIPRELVDDLTQKLNLTIED